MSARRQFARAGIAAIAVRPPRPADFSRGRALALRGFFGPCAQAQSPRARWDASKAKIFRSRTDHGHRRQPSASPRSGDLVSNGSIVTVHSGHARHDSVRRRPSARFAARRSSPCCKRAAPSPWRSISGACACNCPLNSSLRVFTPTIIATPLDISGGARDVAVGLNLDDSLCVRATSGAIQLEHQFSGEKLIVPQAGRIFPERRAALARGRNAGKLRMRRRARFFSHRRAGHAPAAPIRHRHHPAVTTRRTGSHAFAAAGPRRRPARLIRSACSDSSGGDPQTRTGFRSAVAC